MVVLSGPAIDVGGEAMPSSVEVMRLAEEADQRIHASTGQPSNGRESNDVDADLQGFRPWRWRGFLARHLLM
ncbi:hypothetical protein GCM10009550_69460 [Actinocorallia libanotica]|uniref:Uncharacterized protein n=1 Tax=Actinocorallia libanotica TaxID=46162 RepID=A0ABP4CH66_9ACTN